MYDYSKKHYDSVIAYRGFSDGGVQGQSDWTCTGKAACGWVPEVGLTFSSDGVIQWTPLMHASDKGSLVVAQCVTFVSLMSARRAQNFTVYHPVSLPIRHF